MTMFKLWLGFLVVALVAADDAQVPDDIAGFYGKIREEKPRPCCAPSSSTSESTHFRTDSLGISLGVEIIQARNAYDSIRRKTASKVHFGFFNGTEEFHQTIDDYATGVSYYIYQYAGGLICSKNALTERFQGQCIPEDATYVGSRSLGDRSVEVNSWYILQKYRDIDVHIVATFEKDECVFMHSTRRHVEPETDLTYTFETKNIANFKLGICEQEEEEFFHVPDFCRDEAMVNDDSKIPEEVRRKIALLNASSRFGF